MIHKLHRAINKEIKHQLNHYLDILESLLSIIVLIGVGAFLLGSLETFAKVNWSSIDTFYTFVNYILALVVGIELAKLMITHDVFAITNLLAFVVARKMLAPDTYAIDILWGVISFGILFVISLYGKDHELDIKNVLKQKPTKKRIKKLTKEFEEKVRGN